jgi:hypothetical protein
MYNFCVNKTILNAKKEYLVSKGKHNYLIVYLLAWITEFCWTEFLIEIVHMDLSV